MYPPRVGKKIWFIIELDKARTLSFRHHKDIYSEDERGSSLEMVSSVLAAIAFTVTEILLLSKALDYPE